MENNNQRLVTDIGYFSNERRQMLEFIPSDCKTLLDIGCGTGAFGSLVKKRFGAEIWGVDPSEAAAHIATKVFDNFTNLPFSEDIVLPRNYFDAITFNDCLEHFADPFLPLKICRDLLKPNGVVISSIPNVRYIENLKHLLIEMDWKYEDSGIRDRTHLRFFTKKSMLRLFEEANYQVVSIQGINPRYWIGKRFFPIKILIGRWIEDMNYLNYAIVAKPNRD